MNNEKEQVIALAGTIQALSEVQSIATRGKLNEKSTLPILYSIINYNPNNTLSAYNNDITYLFFGLKQLEKLFSNSLDHDLVQYALTVISIERKMVNNIQMRKLLQEQMQTINSEVKNNALSLNESDLDNESENEKLENELISNNTIAKIADAYKKTASNIEPRVMVKGDQQYLRNEISANKIRALLFGALRGAAFFRHYGGSRISFMTKRKSYLDIIKNIS